MYYFCIPEEFSNAQLKNWFISPLNSQYRDHTFFHALTFAGSLGSCLNVRPLGRVFKHRPRDPTSVNALKQTCVIVILACFT